MKNKKVRLNLVCFFNHGATIESDALFDFASGAPLAWLERKVYKENTLKAVTLMRRIGVKRSRAKVREFITKYYHQCIWDERMFFQNAMWSREGAESCFCTISP